MKNILKTLTALMLIIFISCEDKIHELSVDPDASPSANDAEVLTSAIGWIGIIQDADLNDDSFLWAQYKTWGIGVSIGNAERYIAEPDDKNTLWRRYYASALTDLKYLKGSESAAYRGVAEVLTAYTFQSIVDHWGNVPYSEALNGEIADGSVVTPKFDDAGDIYAALITSLDAAIADMNLAAELGQDTDIDSDDLIFGGDLGQWIKMANSLKLRLLMRTSEVDPQGTVIATLISTGSFLSSASDIAEISWPGILGEENPMYATELSGVGDFYFASNTSVNLLNSLNDPRLEFFYSLATKGPFAGTVRGIDQGSIDNEPFTADKAEYSLSSTYANGPAVSTILMSPWEVWFLRAEAAARYSTSDNAATALTTAVQLNMDHIGVSAVASTPYIGSVNFNFAGAANLDEEIDIIAIQKWISFNGTQEDEGWIETRRFDRPASRLFADGIFFTPQFSVLSAGQHPASWLYPQSELSFNSANAPVQRAITDRIFWDN